MRAPPRLPRLQPQLNRRAQQIVEAHLRSASAGPVAITTGHVSVLSQLDSTAPKTARTHDISHLCDKASYLTPTIPPSLIEEQDHIVESSFLPKDGSSRYSENDGLWHTKVFPSAVPSSRADAVFLDAWITRALEKYCNEEGDNANLVTAVEDLVPILSVGLHEVVRQVMHYCAERAVTLEKIWRTYVELFDRVMRQMQESLREHKARAMEAQKHLAKVEHELEGVRQVHPQLMRRVIEDCEAEFAQTQLDLERDVATASAFNAEHKHDLRVHQKEQEIWFPNFTKYQDSYMKVQLQPQQMMKAGQGRPNWRGQTSAQQTDLTPEVVIAEDFKRILTTLVSEKRVIIGAELVELLDGQQAAANQRQQPSPKRSPTAANSSKKQVKSPAPEEPQEDEALSSLQAELLEQEAHIAKLKQKLEKLQATKHLTAVQTLI